MLKIGLLNCTTIGNLDWKQPLQSSLVQTLLKAALSRSGCSGTHVVYLKDGDSTFLCKLLQYLTTFRANTQINNLSTSSYIRY